jgi:multicomponent K+:H+ antiporter subunit G
MIEAPDLPLWAAIAVGALSVAGAAMTLLGSIGLLRFKTFYDRLHPPTLGSSSGTLLIVAASILCFSVLRSRISVHEILIALFVTLTTPVTFMLLARAALYRDRVEGNADVPRLEDPDTASPHSHDEGEV